MEDGQKKFDRLHDGNIFLQATYKRSLQSFALPLVMNGMRKTQSDHVRLHLLLLILS